MNFVVEVDEIAASFRGRPISATPSDAIIARNAKRRVVPACVSPPEGGRTCPHRRLPCAGQELALI
jgi:hypothetical protein